MSVKQAIPSSDLADSWVAGFTPQAAQKIKKKVQALNVNPMQLAATAEAQQKYLTSVTEAVGTPGQGRMAQALNNADVNMWKTNTSDTTAWSNSKTKGKAKYQKKMDKMSAVYAQASAAAAAVTGPLEKVAASINTMRAAVGKPPIA
jgi:gamma-glutamyl:cysteine ligase YbdK (ATP-grasp superfamily)